MTGQSSSQAATPVQWWKPALFFLVVIIGLWYVKWQPYYGKAFTAADTHSIGKSILAQADSSPLRAAWDYAMVYFLAVWKAAVLGVLLGSLIQVLIPRNWLVKTLGQPRLQGTLLGTIFSLPGMMCSCCAAPVAAGMRRQRVSMGGALAFWMGNPLLNPATLVFRGFVLGWHFAFIRLAAGRTGAGGGARLAVPACGWRYRQHADVGDCDGGGRVPVCDPNRGGDPDYSDHDDGWYGDRTGAGAAHHAAGGEPAVAYHAA